MRPSKLFSGCVYSIKKRAKRMINKKRTTGQRENPFNDTDEKTKQSKLPFYERHNQREHQLRRRYCMCTSKTLVRFPEMQLAIPRF